MKLFFHFLDVDKLERIAIMVFLLHGPHTCIPKESISQTHMYMEKRITRWRNVL